MLAHIEVKMQNVNSHVHSNAPIETEMSCDNFDSIGGFKSCDCLQFCIGELVHYRKCTPSIVHIHQHVLSLFYSLIVFLSMAGLPSWRPVTMVTLMLCMHYCLVVHNQTCSVG